MVNIISKDGKPLISTDSYEVVRKLLKQGLAKIIKKDPLTIRLLYETSTYIQPRIIRIKRRRKYLNSRKIPRKIYWNTVNLKPEAQKKVLSLLKRIKKGAEINKIDKAVEKFIKEHKNALLELAKK